MVSHRVIRMSITLAVIIGIALPAMVQQVPAAERKSRKRQHKPLSRKTASKTQSVGSPAGKQGNLMDDTASAGPLAHTLVPKSLVSSFRACAEAHKARLVAKLKGDKSTQPLLLQIQKGLRFASDKDKGMIAAALNSLQGTIVAGTAQTPRQTKPQSGATGLGYRQCPPPLGLYDSDNLQASTREHLKQVEHTIQNTQHNLTIIIDRDRLVSPPPIR